jgi:phage gpG-like protein
MPDFTLPGFAAFLGAFAIENEAENRHALEKAAVIVEKEAKRVIGTYDYNWPTLAPSTQAHHTKMGANPDEPLLITGKMRNSIQHSADHKEAHIGSNEDIAVWQELGTAKIPPRSFLMQAAIHKTDEVVKSIGGDIVGFLAGRRTHSSLVRN